MIRRGVDRIAHSKTKKKRVEKHNRPRERKFGQSLSMCVICGSKRGHISRYGLHVCRRCFREVAEELGFKKYE
jgi:small subunit ribosomal protein S14